jgi:hypothetical protein
MVASEEGKTLNQSSRIEALLDELEQWVKRDYDKAARIEALETALRLARKRIEYYGSISDRRHFDHDLAEVYPKIDAALTPEQDK